jgi:hypothetical protein
MKLLRYNKETKQLAVEVKMTLTNDCIEILKWLAAREHGQVTFDELIGVKPKGEEQTEEEFDKGRERWQIIHYLQECFLVEEKAIGPTEAVKEIFQITDSGKLVLKMDTGELNEKGTTYA